MILLSDLHLDEFKQFSTMSEGVNTRLIDQIWLIGQISKIVEETNTKNVLFLGDMYNSLSYSLPKNVYQAAYYFVKSLAKYTHVWMLVGNHDLHMGRHLFGLYENLDNVSVIAKRNLGVRLEGYSIDMIPYGYDIPDRDHMSDILVGHLEVRGSTMNASGIKTEYGIEPSSLEGYKYVFLGHYHEAQMLDVPRATWAGYIGSIMQIDLGSSPDNKGLTLFKDGIVNKLTLPSPRIYQKIVHTQKEVEDLLPQVEGGDYWRITVKEPGISFPSFDHRVQIEYDVAPKTETRLESRQGEPLIDTVLRFIDTVDMKVDKDMAKSMAKEMMR